jgi:hypothetical protein
MNELYRAWLDRKVQTEPFVPMHEWIVSKQWSRTVPRAMFGAVTLRVEPSDSFRFDSNCTFPLSPDQYLNAVIDGIFDALFVDLNTGPERGLFVLHAMEWREGISVPYAYYRATREAVSEAFALNEQERCGIRCNTAL